MEFDWVPGLVVARVVRRSAVTLALVTCQVPAAAEVAAEARERLSRATSALLVDVRAQPSMPHVGHARSA